MLSGTAPVVSISSTVKKETKKLSLYCYLQFTFNTIGLFLTLLPFTFLKILFIFYTGVHYISQASLESVVFLPQTPTC